MSESTRAEVIRPSAPLFDEGRLAVAAFLARYGAPTRPAYACDLRAWFAWSSAGPNCREPITTAPTPAG